MNQLSRGQIYHKVTVLADFILDAIQGDPDRTKGFLCDFDCNIVGGQRKFIDYKFPNVHVTKAYKRIPSCWFIQKWEDVQRTNS